MIVRATLIPMLVAMALIAACDRTETSSPVTTTSPAGTSTAPSSDSAKHRDEALVRVVHAAPVGTRFDLFAGDLLLFDGLGYKAVTPYRAVDGKRYAFALRPAGMPQAKPLSSNTEGLHNGDFYTAFAMPGDGYTPRLRVVNDHLTTPASGKARVRIVHAAADIGEIDIRAAGSSDRLFEGVDYQAVTDYRDVSPVSGAIEIVGGDTAQAALTSFNTHLEAGRFYTIMIVGSAQSSPRIEAFLIEDALTP